VVHCGFSCSLTIGEPFSASSAMVGRSAVDLESVAQHYHDLQVESDMTHKFKIGQTVIFRPRERSARAEGGTFRIIGFASEGRGEPIYRLTGC
jgi:hypothetical protein